MFQALVQFPITAVCVIICAVKNLNEESVTCNSYLPLFILMEAEVNGNRSITVSTIGSTTVEAASQSLQTTQTC